MKITALIENISKQAQLEHEHGLSLYIETLNHKILLDTGATRKFADNAQKMGIDLTKVDTVVLSHGHYDHGGGLREFLQHNQIAKIYIRTGAFGDYYDAMENEYEYIGIDFELQNHPQIIMVSEDVWIDKELFLFGKGEGHEYWPKTNAKLVEKRNETYKPDLFEHEQSLVIYEGEKSVLLSGCAHNGIINILNKYHKISAVIPDMVISGFHLKQKESISEETRNEMVQLAKALYNYGKCEVSEQGKIHSIQYYTCHCTGIPAYEILKEVMQEHLNYLSTGDVIEL